MIRGIGYPMSEWQLTCGEKLFNTEIQARQGFDSTTQCPDSRFMLFFPDALVSICEPEELSVLLVRVQRTYVIPKYLVV